MIDDTQPQPMPDRSPDKRSRSRGQSMVEFAVVLPIMLMLLLIAADFGRAYTAYLTISSAAREGAVYASRSSDNAADTAGITTRTLEEVGGTSGEIWGEPMTVSISDCSASDSQGYDCVAVTVDYTFEPMMAIWPIPDSVSMDRTVSMRVLGN